MTPGRRDSRLGKSLLLASLLHAAVLAWSAYARRTPPVPVPPAEEPLVWVEAPSEPEPRTEVPERESEAEARGSGAQGRPERVAALMTPRSDPSGFDAVEPGGDEPRGDEPALEDAEGEGEGEAEPAEPGRPTLTPEQLGLGDSRLFWDRRPPKTESRTARAQKRLRRALSTEIARQDQRRGLGPEGPVLTRLEREARAALTAPNSTALLRVVTDRTGRVVSLTVVEATSAHRRDWDEVAKRTLLALAKTELRTQSPHGVSFDVRVVGRVELPSGADPGVNVNAGGVPLVKGKGSRSTSVDILGLTDGEWFGTELPPPSAGDPLNLPGLANKRAAGVTGDLADLGQTARRMVRAYVERLWANEPPPEAPAPN